jgi:hypothetical protein
MSRERRAGAPHRSGNSAASQAALWPRARPAASAMERRLGSRLQNVAAGYGAPRLPGRLSRRTRGVAQTVDSYTATTAKLELCRHAPWSRARTPCIAARYSSSQASFRYFSASSGFCASSLRLNLSRCRSSSTPRRSGPASITTTLDRYGHLLPGSLAEATTLLDAYLDSSGARTGARE